MENFLIVISGIDWDVKVYNTCKVFKLKNERWEATMILKNISDEN